MPGFTVVWDDNLPADTEALGLGASRIRNLAAAIAERLATISDFPGSNGVVTLLDNIITEAMLQDDIVTRNKILDGEVIESKLADGSVTARTLGADVTLATFTARFVTVNNPGITVNANVSQTVTVAAGFTTTGAELVIIANHDKFVQSGIIVSASYQPPFNSQSPGPLALSFFNTGSVAKDISTLGSISIIVLTPL